MKQSANKWEILTLHKNDIRDFATERNHLLKNVMCEWVFFVDTDETVTEELRREIELKIEKNGFSGYKIKRRNFFLGKYVGSDKIIRLGRKNAGKWVRGVHEVWDIKGRVGLLRNPLIHNTAHNLHDYIGKINFYSSLHAKANLEEGKRPNLFKIIFYPPGKFIVTLVKSKNMVFSIMQSLHSFLAWSKQWELTHRSDRAKNA